MNSSPARTPQTLGDMCDTIAASIRAVYGTAPTTEQIYGYSKHGELFAIWDWYTLAHLAEGGTHEGLSGTWAGVPEPASEDQRMAYRATLAVDVSKYINHETWK